MITLVTVIHVLVCVFLILVILLQAGKGGGMGAAFGGAGSQTVFGGRGATTFLSKITATSAAIFMVTSLTLAYHSSRTQSVVARQAAPAQPVPAPGAPQPFVPGSSAEVPPGPSAPAAPKPSH
ncbi:MAG TPA: preprotein translocase subunit SecG [Anaeromyxobacteraceae bacterium]|nr:preprotein translocase subunit SecG [Anaeromyxobacteraceae bacterium]